MVEAPLPDHRQGRAVICGPLVAIDFFRRGIGDAIKDHRLEELKVGRGRIEEQFRLRCRGSQWLFLRKKC